MPLVRGWRVDSLRKPSSQMRDTEQIGRSGVIVICHKKNYTLTIYLIINHFS